MAGKVILNEVLHGCSIRYSVIPPIAVRDWISISGLIGKYGLEIPGAKTPPHTARLKVIH